jgi:D-methionine transport system substrate-binding protein
MKIMKKLLLSLALVLTLTACGGAEASDSEETSAVQTLKVAATSVPHAEILEEAASILKDEHNIELEVVVVQDYVTPNQFLDNHDVDANYFQHIPYFNAQIEEFGYDFTNAGGIHIEPIGVYSQDYKDINDLPEGATIIFSSSVADHGRILSLLEVNGLIELNPDVDKVTATIDDVTSNPKNFVFKSDIEASLLPTAYNNNEGDAVIINTNYALQAGLNPLEDAILLEGSESLYVNIITVETEDKDDTRIKALVEVLSSEEITDFIVEKYEGAVVPVN